MKFYIPETQPALAEAAYAAMYKTAREQLRTPITPKRIQQLDYVHDKRRVTACVGQVHPSHPRYTVVAIFESQPHIVMTMANGHPGPTIMVANHEVTQTIEFD